MKRAFYPQNLTYAKPLDNVFSVHFPSLTQRDTENVSWAIGSALSYQSNESCKMSENIFYEHFTKCFLTALVYSSG